MKTCQVEQGLVRELATLSNKLNMLSPAWVRNEAEREEIQQRRDELRIEIKQHRKKGHDGKSCPSFESRKVVQYTLR